MAKSETSMKKSDLKRTEELEIILDSIPGLIFYKDDKNNYIKVNQSFADTHEKTKSELEGKSLFDLYPKEEAQKYFNDDLEVIKSKKPKLNFIEPWDVAQGRRWVNSSKIPLFDENNKCIGIIGFSTDVTTQVKEEQKSKQNQNQLNSIFSNLKDNVFVISEDYKILFKNENAHDIFGEGLNGRNCFEVIKGREQVCDNCTLQILSKNNLCQVRSEQQILSPISNEIKFFDTITSTIENYNGKKVYLEVLRDITERKEKEEALFKLAAIVENSDDAIIGKTLDGTIISWNKSAERVYGYMSQEIIGKSISILVPFGHPNELLGILEKIKVGDHIDHYKTVRVRKDGEEIYISLTISPIKDIAGNIIGASTIARDITERKKIKKKSQEIKDELERNRKFIVLGKLAGGVGHELRNPLGAIKNAIYFLNMVLEKPEPEVKETLEILEREVISSEKIIYSLLSYAHPKSLVVRKVMINDIIRNVLSRSVIPKNVELIDKLGNSLPHVLADPDRLEQVFGNITLNAIQAMSKGGQLIVKSEVQNQDFLSISFNDSGEGISEENLKKIFTPLFTTKAKGIGLGLAICKTIVDKHGGSIEVQSELGRGTTFLIKLPINRKVME